MKETKNILVLTQWSYKDSLIQAYTLPYLFQMSEVIGAQSKIYLVTFEQERFRMSDDERSAAKKMLASKNIILLDHNYSTFGILAMIKWSFMFVRLYIILFSKNIRFIHAWCTPAGALGYLLSIFSGRPLIIDSYEPHAEAMVENNTWSRSGMKFRLLFFLEKKMSRRCKTVISATGGMRDYAQKKYNAEFKKFFIKPACVDTVEFNPSKTKNPELLQKLGLEGKTICVYAGKFGGIYLTKEVFDFFSEALKIIGDKFHVLLLTAHSEEEIKLMATTAGFPMGKITMMYVPHKEIATYMGLGDFGITPVKPIPTKRYCTPIKDGEYWALGLPVVITKNISDDSSIIHSNDAGAVIDELNQNGYRKAALHIFGLLSTDDQLSQKIRTLAIKYRSFDISKKIYTEIYS